MRTARVWAEEAASGKLVRSTKPGPRKRSGLFAFYVDAAEALAYERRERNDEDRNALHEIAFTEFPAERHRAGIERVRVRRCARGHNPD